MVGAIHYPHSDPNQTAIISYVRSCSCAVGCVIPRGYKLKVSLIGR